jgi:hypothetical protein
MKLSIMKYRLTIRFCILSLCAGLLLLGGCARPLPTTVEQVRFKDPLFQTCVEKKGVQQLSAITELSCNESPLKNVEELQYLTGLTRLELETSMVKKVDLSHNQQLKEVILYGFDKRTTLNFGVLPLLKSLQVDTPELLEQFSHIDLKTSFPQLRDLHIAESGRKQPVALTQLALSHPLIERLWISGNEEHNRSKPEDSTYDLILDLPQLTTLLVEDTPLHRLELTNTPLLNDFTLSRTELTTLELHHLPQLKQVVATDNRLVTISLQDLPLLINLCLDSNRLTHLDLTNLPGLEQLLANNNQLETVIWPQKSQMNIISLKDNQLTTLDLYTLEHLGAFDVTGNPLPKIADIDFDEPQIKERLLDLDYVYTTEVLQFTEMAGSREYLATTKDLSYFKNLHSLYLDLAEGQGPLDLSALKGLRWLKLGSHDQTLPSLVLPQSPYLLDVRVDELNLEEIHIPPLPALKYLDLYNNKLSNIDLPSLPALERLILNNNPLGGIFKLDNYPNLVILGVRNTGIEGLYLDNFPALREVLAEDNPIHEMYIYRAPLLGRVDVDCEKIEAGKSNLCH